MQLTMVLPRGRETIANPCGLDDATRQASEECYPILNQAAAGGFLMQGVVGCPWRSRGGGTPRMIRGESRGQRSDWR
jgi:hypothetical protein